MATKWSDLSTLSRCALVAAGAAETVTTALALRDLVRRPAVRVRGPKPAWAVACLVQPVGPLAYLTLGRR